MAWNRGNKRWTIPFVSLNGTSCRIDIYKRGYTGSEVIELSTNNANAPAVAAAEPFIFQEDDEEDLLSVVRVKSGYLRLIEKVYGGLEEFYPATSHDHYVEMYYGMRRKFTGFVKAQTFGNEWQAPPREMEFTVVSPLGLTDGMFFAKSDNPDFRTLGTIMREVINGLQADISYIDFPDPDRIRTYCMFRMCMSSTVILPEDGEYHYDNDAQDLFSARSYWEFLEGLCNCFGLIVHDEPGHLVFSRFDYDGTYSRIQLSNIADGQTRSKLPASGATTVDLSEGTSVASNDNTESVVLPMSKISIGYDGGFFNSAGIHWDRCSRKYGTALLDGWSMVVNNPLNGEISSDKLNNDLRILSNGRLSGPGVVFAAVGQGSFTEMVIFQAGEGWNTGVPTIVKFTLCDRPNGHACITFDLKWGSSIADLQNPGDFPSLRIFAKCGPYYYNHSTWTDTPGYSPYIHKDDGRVAYPMGTPPSGYPLEIWIATDIQYLNNEYIYTIQNLAVERGEDYTYDYVYGNNDRDHQEIIGSPSEQEADVSCLFSDQAQTMNYLSVRRGDGGEGSVSKPSNPYYSAYRYMTIQQNRLVVTLQGEMPDHIYIKKMLYHISGWHWRVIAVSFNPWDDTHTLTLHRSSTI